MNAKRLIFGVLIAVLASGAGPVWAGEPDPGTSDRLGSGGAVDPDGDPDDGITGNRGYELIGDGDTESDGDAVSIRFLPADRGLAVAPGLVVVVPILF